MRAGRLDRQITIQRSAYVVNEYGNPEFTWTDIATVRAQLVQAGTEEFLRAYGAIDETVIIFRIRWRVGLTTADRVVHDGQNHDIKEIKEIGRHRGLEIRTVALS